MAGGPTVNILIAFFIFWRRLRHLRPTTTEPEPGQPVVRRCASACCPTTRRAGTCTADDPPSPGRRGRPAARRRDRRRSTASRSTDWDQLQDLIRDNDDGEAVVTLERDGEQLTCTTNTTVEARPADRHRRRRCTEVGFLGVVSGTARGRHDRRPALHARPDGHDDRRDRPGAGHAAGQGLGRRARRSSASRSAPRTARSASSAAAGSPARPRAHDEFPVKEKAVFLLMLIAGFNFFIGMFNFIPLLPLDGGHIAGALWEAIRRGFARLRGRPDPGYVDVAKLLPVAYVVASVAAGDGRRADRRRPRRPAAPRVVCATRW